MKRILCLLLILVAFTGCSIDVSQDNLDSLFSELEGYGDSIPIDEIEQWSADTVDLLLLKTMEAAEAAGYTEEKTEELLIKVFDELEEKGLIESYENNSGLFTFNYGDGRVGELDVSNQDSD